MEVLGWDLRVLVSFVTARLGTEWRSGLSVLKWMFFPHTFLRGGGLTAQAYSWAGFLITRQGRGWGAGCVDPPPQNPSVVQSVRR